MDLGELGVANYELWVNYKIHVGRMLIMWQGGKILACFFVVWKVFRNFAALKKSACAIDACMVADADFRGAANLIEEAYPEGLPLKIDVKDIQKLNSLSLSKDVTEWDASNSPVGNSTPAYKTLALQFLHRS